jgi:hypothetical protein
MSERGRAFAEINALDCMACVLNALSGMGHFVSLDA